MERTIPYRLLNKRWVAHAIFWLGLVTAFALLLGGKYGYWISLRNVALTSAVYAIVVYLNILVLIPFYLKRQQYKAYFSSLLLVILLVTPLHAAVEYYTLYNTPELYNQVDFLKLGFFSLINLCIMLMATTGLKFAREWFKNQQERQELEREKLQAELRFLKSQINPHFLFNTLNNLYSLTLKKSDKAPDMVLKLAEMMRYMLYDSNEREVPLEKEINFIRNYIELERIRQSKNTTIRIDINGHVNGQMIAPLLFIPFLENSFKHGVNNNLDDCLVDIRMEVQDTSVWLTVKNSKPKEAAKAKGPSGIGLQNVKRRLELLYPQRHSLSIEDGESNYKAELSINLQS